jgi:hypothetical protein
LPRGKQPLGAILIFHPAGHPAGIKIGAPSMNHIYRLIWNSVSHTFVAVSEFARGCGKKTSTTRTARGARSAAARRGVGLQVLEPRIMFDGAAVATADAAHVLPDATAHALIPEAPAPVQVRAADPAQDGGKKEVAFVDTSVADYQTLVAGMRDGVEIVEIQSNQNGLAQIALWAQSHSGYDALHLFSHGNDALLYLGNQAISNSELATASVQAQLAEIGHALNSDGDLLLYGCDVAAGADGLQFIRDLSNFTGADVAASSDATGSVNRGGDWDLEVATGAIEAAAPIHAQNDYTGLLAITSQNFDSAAYTDKRPQKSRPCYKHSPLQAFGNLPCPAQRNP